MKALEIKIKTKNKTHTNHTKNNKENHSKG